MDTSTPSIATTESPDARPRLDGMQKAARVVATIVLFVANLFLILYAPYVAIWVGGGPWVNNASFIIWDWNGYGLLPTVVGTIVWGAYLVAWAQVATLVAFRRRDALLWLIPIIGLVFTARILYRLCAYQVKDWPPAPEVYAVGPIEARLRLLGARVRRLTPWSI